MATCDWALAQNGEAVPAEATTSLQVGDELNLAEVRTKDHALYKAGNQFNLYAELHQSKGNLRKAAQNLQFAAMCERAIELSSTDTSWNVLHSIFTWQKTICPTPDNAAQAVAIGVHYEELSEMMIALDDVTALPLHVYAAAYKKKQAAPPPNLDKLELLDALCDQIVTAIGVAYRMGFDIMGALEEVDTSNWSKFEDGKPIYDANGKAIKGRNYRPPELSKFVGGATEQGEMK